MKFEKYGYLQVANQLLRKMIAGKTTREKIFVTDRDVEALKYTIRQTVRLENEINNSMELTNDYWKAIETIAEMAYLIKKGDADLAWVLAVEYLEDVQVDKETLEENRKVIFKKYIEQIEQLEIKLNSIRFLVENPFPAEDKLQEAILSVRNDENHEGI